MIIKGWYILDGDYIKSVKFEADRNGKPLNKNIIYDNAPENWDICKWDQGEVKPKKTKVVEEVVEIPSTDEIADSE